MCSEFRNISNTSNFQDSFYLYSNSVYIGYIYISIYNVRIDAANWPPVISPTVCSVPTVSSSADQYYISICTQDSYN